MIGRFTRPQDVEEIQRLATLAKVGTDDILRFVADSPLLQEHTRTAIQAVRATTSSWVWSTDANARTV